MTWYTPYRMLLYEKRCKCYRLTGSNKEYQTNLCPIHKDN